MTGKRAVFEAALKRGHNYAWDKQWMKAIEEYKLAVAEFPDNAVARNSLAFAYLKGKRLREALREYRKVGELRPNDPSPLREMAVVLEQLGRAADAAETWMALARLCVEQNALSRAAEAWREAVRLQPANKEGRQQLAEAYASRSDGEEAAKEYLALARLYREEGDSAKAKECCRLALSFDGRSSDARALWESLTSGRDTGVVEPSLLPESEGLGPVDVAVQQALTSLAEAVLAEEELANVTEQGATGGDGPAPLPSSQQDVRTVLGRAIDYHSRGRAEEAATCYEKALQIGVSRAEVAFNLGLLYKEASRFSEAIGLLERSLESPEYRLAGHFALAECHWADGHVDQAVHHFLEALKVVDLETIGGDRADDVRQSYQDIIDRRELEEAGGKAEVFVSSLTELLGGSDWKRKVMEVRQKLNSLAEGGFILILPEFLGTPGCREVLDIMTRSQEYLKDDMPFVALEECYRAIGMASTWLPLHLRLAEVFAAQGKVEEAVSKYGAVADAFLMRNRPRRAVEVYRRALVVAPMNVRIREKLIGLLIDQGETDLALEQYLALGESYYRLARVDEALQKYEEARSVVPRATRTDWEVKILHRMADLHMQRVQWDRAVEIYERIRQLSPDDDEACLRLVDLGHKLGQQNKALKELDGLIIRWGKEREHDKVVKTLRELVDSNPQDIRLRSRLGMTYVEAGMKEEAIAELDTLGELQLEAGLKQDAMDTLRTIVSLEPPQVEEYTRLLRNLLADSA